MRGQHESIVSIACGLRHNVALTADGRVLTWGFGAEGCLGHGEAEAVPEVSREGGQEDTRTGGKRTKRRKRGRRMKRWTKKRMKRRMKWIGRCGGEREWDRRNVCIHTCLQC